LAAIERKKIGVLAVGIVGAICLFFLGREVTHEGALGESHNPYYGHPLKVPGERGHPTPSFGNMSEEQYYQGLKANRPDLSETELRAKADHWWKVRNGQAAVSGG
jgi:hypothetical protein